MEIRISKNAKEVQMINKMCFRIFNCLEGLDESEKLSALASALLIEVFKQEMELNELVDIIKIAYTHFKGIRNKHLKEDSDVISVLKRLPNDGQKCMCFGHKTFCCQEDMDEAPSWHKVVFNINFSSYKLKDEIPEDLEDSIFESYEVKESWDIDEQYRVIGVTKWMPLKNE